MSSSHEDLRIFEEKEYIKVIHKFKKPLALMQRSPKVLPFLNKSHFQLQWWCSKAYISRWQIPSLILPLGGMIETSKTTNISNSLQLKASFYKNDIYIVLAIENHEFKKINFLDIACVFYDFQSRNSLDHWNHHIGDLKPKSIVNKSLFM